MLHLLDWLKLLRICDCGANLCIWNEQVRSIFFRFRMGYLLFLSGYFFCNSFDEDMSSLQLVAAFVHFGNQVLHLVTVKGCHTDKFLVEHGTECPCVDHLGIPAS